MPKISAATLQEHRAETLDRLLDAWGELVMARGYADVSLADVAAHAGIARTAIYNYFPDREALLFAWTDREVERSLDRLRHELATETTYAGKLRTFVRTQLEDFRARHLPPGKEVMQLLGPETYQRFMRHIDPLENILTAIITEGMAAGEFASVEADGVVPLVMATIGAERVPISTRAHEVDEATDRVTAFLLRALGAKPPSAKKPRRKPNAERSDR